MDAASHNQEDQRPFDGEGDSAGAENWPPEDIPQEIAKLLRARRSRRKKKPFQGFNSPPGRF